MIAAVVRGRPQAIDIINIIGQIRVIDERVPPESFFLEIIVPAPFGIGDWILIVPFNEVTKSPHRLDDIPVVVGVIG